jgi:hypothetical protein
VNYAKSQEVEGHDLSEYLQVVTAVGPVQYIVGTAANAALLGSWPREGSLPQEGHKFTFYAATDTLVYFVPLWMIIRQNLPPASGGLPAGLPVPQLIPKTTLFTFTTKAVWIFYQAAVAQATGNLDIWIEG